MKVVQYLLLGAAVVVPSAVVDGAGDPGLGMCSSGDCENGWGVKDYGDDYMYEGEFKDGEHHGVGIESMPEGVQYIGPVSYTHLTLPTKRIV